MYSVLVVGPGRLRYLLDYLSEELRVLLYEAIPLCRDACLDKNSRHRADRLAGAAVGTGGGIYIHLLVIGATLDTVNRTNINARQLLRADARLTYYVGQTSRSGLASLLEVLGVHSSEVLPLLRKIVFGKDRLDWAGGLARTTVDAFVGMDV